MLTIAVDQDIASTDDEAALRPLAALALFLDRLAEELADHRLLDHAELGVLADGLGEGLVVHHSSIDDRVQSLELDAGVSGGEPPVGARLPPVAVLLACRHGGGQGGLVRHPRG